jgi:DMSO/TMAO reductase YedYZ molybdopterin-dependent catalytic subunit
MKDESFDRRTFLKLAGLTILASCSDEQKDAVLEKGQRFNDKVQASVFDSSRLAPTYADRDLTPESGFRVNGKDPKPPVIDVARYHLEISGLVKHPGLYTLDQVKQLDKKVENVRHVCVEGWSMKPKWGGTRLSDFLDWVGADLNAKYLRADCADGYYVPYDMPSVRHPQSLLCYEAYNKPLTAEHGAPLRIVMPTKLGYKSAKWITKLTITNEKPGGYWEDQGYDWYGGL